MNPEIKFCPMTPVAQKPLSWRTLFVSPPFLVLVPGLVLADSPSPTPPATPALQGDQPGRDGASTSAEHGGGHHRRHSVGWQHREVSTLLAQRSQTLHDFLREQGVERLRTENISFAPQIESVHGGPDRVVGFTGQVFVSFRTTPDKLGALLRGGLEHGANSVSQTEFTPLESDIDTARRDLAIEAMKNGLARADAIAQAAGQRVIRIENINVEPEEGVRPTPFAVSKQMTLSSPPTPIATAAGEHDISVRVSVQVVIERKSE